MTNFNYDNYDDDTKAKYDDGIEFLDDDFSFDEDDDDIEEAMDEVMGGSSNKTTTKPSKLSLEDEFDD